MSDERTLFAAERNLCAANEEIERLQRLLHDAATAQDMLHERLANEQREIERLRAERDVVHDLCIETLRQIGEDYNGPDPEVHVCNFLKARTRELAELRRLSPNGPRDAGVRPSERDTM